MHKIPFVYYKSYVYTPTPPYGVYLGVPCAANNLPLKYFKKGKGYRKSGSSEFRIWPSFDPSDM